MKCPSCGLINASSAERCDCGHGFRDGSFIRPERPATLPAARLRNAGCTTGVAALAAAFILRAVSSGKTPLAVLLGALGDLAMLIAVIGLIVWIIGSLRLKRNT